MEVFCDMTSCKHQDNGNCTAKGISIIAYNDYPDDIECETYEFDKEARDEHSMPED